MNRRVDRAHSRLRRAALVVAGLASALSIVGCSALFGAGGDGPTSTQAAEQAHEASCEIIRSAWGSTGVLA